MKAVILAAGRGSRMRDQTSDKPKCLLELAGRPLLSWQLDALRQAGADDILVVRGYRGEKLTPAGLGLPPDAFATADNPRWAETNMLSTLLCADAFIRGKRNGGDQEGAVIAYADIVYHPAHVASLARSPHDIAITYDTAWEALWTLRFGDPLLDAETFRAEGGLLREIGGKPERLADIAGQYMGLIHVTPRGWHMVAEYCAKLGPRVDKTDMTGFLRGLLADGADIGAVPVAGCWCEADNGTDLERYAEALATGSWSHDWRMKEGEKHASR